MLSRLGLLPECLIVLVRTLDVLQECRVGERFVLVANLRFQVLSLQRDLRITRRGVHLTAVNALSPLGCQPTAQEHVKLLLVGDVPLEEDSTRVALLLAHPLHKTRFFGESLNPLFLQLQSL